MLTDNKPALLVGYRAAVLTAIFSGLFFALLFVSLFGLETIYWSFAVVMLMSFSFVAMQAAVYSAVSEKEKIFALLGVIAASMFSVFVSIAYYVQLTVVMANPLGVSSDVIRLISYTPGSLSFALDILGYTLLCLSISALLPIFRNGGDRLLRGFLWINSLLTLPTFIFPIFFIRPGIPVSDKLGSVMILIWVVIFLPVPMLLAAKMKNARAQQET